MPTYESQPRRVNDVYTPSLSEANTTFSHNSLTILIAYAFGVLIIVTGMVFFMVGIEVPLLMLTGVSFIISGTFLLVQLRGGIERTTLAIFDDRLTVRPRLASEYTIPFDKVKTIRVPDDISESLLNTSAIIIITTDDVKVKLPLFDIDSEKRAEAVDALRRLPVSVRVKSNV